MRILFFGDIVGKIGRRAVANNIKKLVETHKIDFVIANAENATHGMGLSLKHYNYLIHAGIDCITLGNHYSNRSEIYSYISDADKLVRPINLLDKIEGVGTRLFDCNGVKIRVSNVLGKAFIRNEVSEPYLALQNIIDEYKDEHSIHIVDFHAESSGEKTAMAYAFDGKVSAFVCTHTHVQTNDARVFPNGTGFICDIGMCGAYGGVLGFEKSSVINKTLFGKRTLFDINDKDAYLINAVVIDVDEETLKCREIYPIKIVENKK